MENAKDIEQAVYDAIKLHCEYARATKCMPVQIMHSLLLELMSRPERGGLSTAQVNAALSVLFRSGKIHAGRTAHGCYITLPEYRDQ